MIAFCLRCDNCESSFTTSKESERCILFFCLNTILDNNMYLLLRVIEVDLRRGSRWTSGQWALHANVEVKHSS
jgi:hypothetical protein